LDEEKVKDSTKDNCRNRRRATGVNKDVFQIV